MYPHANARKQYHTFDLLWLLDLKIADITQDQEFLIKAREAAFELLDRDPHLRDEAHAELRAYYERYYAGLGIGLARVG